MPRYSDFFLAVLALGNHSTSRATRCSDMVEHIDTTCAGLCRHFHPTASEEVVHLTQLVVLPIQVATHNAASYANGTIVEDGAVPPQLLSCKQAPDVTVHRA